MCVCVCVCLLWMIGMMGLGVNLVDTG
uniref:Uncharacterized protein n=1 Tax=Nelumbo nucifera TaxID=4432 RepID=A0A822Z9E6_NELNU|nr:TPA_asm: hypothetical protein HUJ06_008799 [Nelumbo nucifera]